MVSGGLTLLQTNGRNYEIDTRRMSVLTDHLITSHSVIPSPISASLKVLLTFADHGYDVWKSEMEVGRLGR